MVDFIKKVTKCIGISISIFLIVAISPIFLSYRKILQYRIIKKRNKRLQNGIHILEPITIGGLQQWISVRGEHKDNPVLLFLHGGPGGSMMPSSYILEPLESHYTIVQWDQRGTGKTYRANKKSAFIHTLTMEQMHADTLEMVNYLRHRFNKQKIIVLGHSWGSILGLKLAQDYPELISAYIGVGQIITMNIAIKMGYDAVLKMAHTKNNKRAVMELEALLLFHDRAITLKEFLVLRKWQNRFNKELVRKSLSFPIIMNILSAPDYTLLDTISLVRGMLLSCKIMFLQMMAIDLENKTNLQVPFLILAGRHDYIAPPEPAYDYFEKAQAPYKNHIWFEESGHNLFFEETNKCIDVIRDLRLYGSSDHGIDAKNRTP